MISLNHSLSGCLAAVLLACALLCSEASARGQASDRTSTPIGGDTSRSQWAAQIRADVGEIAHSASLSRAKKEKRISIAVRIAVVGATSYKEDPAEILDIALDIATAAAGAAPAYAEVISNAVSFAPAVAKLGPVAGQIRTAAFAAAKAPKRRRAESTAVAYAGEPVPSTRITLPEAEAPAPAPRASATPPSDHSSEEPSFHPAPASSWPDRSTGKVATDRNSSFNLTAEAGVRHDDNVYLNDLNKVGDTIYTVTPGVEAHYGQNSLIHGNAAIRDSFVRYANKAAPDMTLLATTADFGYDTGTLSTQGSGSFQQFSQNTAAGGIAGSNQVFRYNVLALDASVESAVTAKTRLKAGVDINNTHYKTPGLTGSDDTTIPFRIYYETTPKLNISTGFDYRDVEPQGGGPKGRDLYYNVGFRGYVTPKLNGEVSVGYRTRQVSDQPDEKLWGFQGNLNYDLTPKSDLGLNLTRDFSNGAQGESLKTTNIALKFSTEPVMQWQLGASVAYVMTDFQPDVFLVNAIPITTQRQDKYWEASVQSTYFLTQAFSATTGYVFRNNRSTIQGVEFTNNVLNLMFDYRY